MKTLEDFVNESNRIEGIEREPDDPQLAREVHATRRFVALTHPSVGALEDFVAVCTSGAAPVSVRPCPAVLRRLPGLNVRVGNYHPPPGGPEIEERLETLLRNLDRLNPFQVHIEYEDLHPFTDGNGRSGRVLWLWQMNGAAPLGFLHRFYYQVLAASSGCRKEEP